jgi:choline transport protein
VVSRSAEDSLHSSPLTPLRSFARDKGIPLHAYFAHVCPTKKTPVRAIMFTLGLTAGLSTFNTFSPVALSTLVSLSLTGLVTSYLLTVISILSYRIRGERLRPSGFNLGKPRIYIKPAR